MNKVILIGRLCEDPTESYTAGENAVAVSRYRLAVNRRGKDKEADFINIVTFGKAAEFAVKYLKKGQRIAISGRIQTGSYTNRDGKKVYTTDVVADEQEFADSKKEDADNSSGFMAIPEGEIEELPFN